MYYREAASKGISRQLPPEENCTPCRVGGPVKVRVRFRVGGNQTIATEKNWPLVRVRGWVKVSFGVGGNFPRGQEPSKGDQIAQKMKFSIMVFFCKCDQIRGKRIWSHLLKKSLMENFIFCAIKSCLGR